MFSFTLSTAITALTALASVNTVYAAPVESALHARQASPVPAAPRFVVYGDKFVAGTQGPPDASQITGFNVFALSFLLSTGAADKALEWTQLTADQRTAVKTQYQQAGISLIVSAFGSTEEPTTQGLDPAATATTMAQFVQQFDLDGIDVDYEDLDAMNKGDGSAEAWLATFTQTIRQTLPVGQFILTHAPLAPWFSTDPLFASGAYRTVDKTVGSMIDWYNIQFYNQGATEYADCPGLLTASSSVFPNSALFEIIAAGISQEKLVIGKPGTAADATNGIMDPATLATCVSQAAAQGWNAGVMAFEFPDAESSFIQTVRGTTFPQ